MQGRHRRMFRKGRLVRPFFMLATAATLAACAASTAYEPPVEASSSAASPAEGRLRAPTLPCDRNHLTSWRGLVTGYRRSGDHTWLQISTEDDTVEDTTLDVPAPPAVPSTYRINGVAFTAGDWARIEAADGSLREGMRATAWVCEDGVTPTVIDWLPAG